MANRAAGPCALTCLIPCAIAFLSWGHISRGSGIEKMNCFYRQQPVFIIADAGTPQPAITISDRFRSDLCASLLNRRG
jgi:hypothetical protein